MDQRTEEWFAARLGNVTGSRVADLMARTRSGYSASRANYMAELIVERLTGQASKRFTTPEMQWGTDVEPEARASYEFTYDRSVAETGFVLHPEIIGFGASPDGLVGDDGLIEIKCPNTATHIETLLGETVPAKYITQMQAQMACTGRAWCDFVSFDPRLPAEMQIWVSRITRDDTLIHEMEREIRAFLNELHEKLDALIGRYSEAA